MSFYKKIMIGLLILPLSVEATSIPNEFVDVREHVPNIIVDIKYATRDNFLGRPVEGYKSSDNTVLTLPTAKALKKVQEELSNFGLGLKIFDAYRPQRAVNDFVKWSKTPFDDSMKELYYPKIDKTNLFKLGFIAERSGHSRGSTVDLTIIDLSTNNELDMGTRFDYFGQKSYPSDKSIASAQRAHRMLLNQLMINNGFIPLKEEWWHFTLDNEPFKNTYFDFTL